MIEAINAIDRTLLELLAALVTLMSALVLGLALIYMESSDE